MWPSVPTGRFAVSYVFMLLGFDTVLFSVLFAFLDQITQRRGKRLTADTP